MVLFLQAGTVAICPNGFAHHRSRVQDPLGMVLFLQAGTVAIWPQMLKSDVKPQQPSNEKNIPHKLSAHGSYVLSKVTRMTFSWVDNSKMHLKCLGCRLIKIRFSFQNIMQYNIKILSILYLRFLRDFIFMDIEMWMDGAASGQILSPRLFIYTQWLLIFDLMRYIILYLCIYFYSILIMTRACRPPAFCLNGPLKPGSHSHDFTGDHRRLDSRGVVAGWSAARLSIVAVVVVRGLLWSPGLS